MNPIELIKSLIKIAIKGQEGDPPLVEPLNFSWGDVPPPPPLSRHCVCNMHLSLFIHIFRFILTFWYLMKVSSFSYFFLTFLTP